MDTRLVPRSLAVRAASQFGLEDRLLLLQEEMGELGVAISHFRRGRCGAWQEVMEELADVVIVLDQVLTCQGVSHDVRTQAGPKIKRLASLLGEEAS